MTDLRDEDRDLLAAEYVLGLLEGDALREARVEVAVDPDFAAAVARWEARLAPLFDEIAETEPPPDMWERIRAAIASAPAAAAVVPMRRSLRLWRGYAAGITAVAASLALLLGYEMTREPPVVVQPEAPTVMIATLSSEAAETSLAVAYDRQRSSLLVTPGRLEGAPGHDHELWIIPVGGTPVSLGLVRPDAPLRIPVSGAVARHFQSRATIALSVEPVGGSPTGQPTGPVVATGELVIV